MNCLWNFDFNPRSPHRERHVDKPITEHSLLFQSTLPSQGATAEGLKIRADLLISIHAPLTGSDETSFLISVVLLISIHAPLTGSDGRPVGKVIAPYVFQSTLPSQGATLESVRSNTSFKFQSTLPSQGATLESVRSNTSFKFQSTLPSQGATDAPTSHFFAIRNFNPRSPHRERRIRAAVLDAIHISIHAPLTGSDRRLVRG